MKLDKKYFKFFWGGELSQWHSSEFSQNDVTFNCAEQYMMYSKALLFDDILSSRKIMATESPKEQQALGRKVSNYDDRKWNMFKESIVLNGNILKFSQNRGLAQHLLSTQERIIVEASPYDKVWGIGMGKDHPDILDMEKWKGENLLGKALMRTRAILREECIITYRTDYVPGNGDDWGYIAYSQGVNEHHPIFKE